MKHSFRLFLALGIIVVLTAYLFTFLHRPGAWHAFPLSLFPHAWRHPVLLELMQALIIALATYLIVRWNLMIPVLLFLCFFFLFVCSFFFFFCLFFRFFSFSSLFLFFWWTRNS